MKILIACEFSGRVRDAFRAKGFDAVSCDLLETEQPGPHIQGDVLTHLNDGWDAMIAHPPCTFLANSGVQHLHKNAGRWEQMRQGREFFLALWNADIPCIAVENPLPHHYAELPPYSQIIHPYYFGEEADKTTCLWLKGLPPLMATYIQGKGKRYIGKDGRSNGSFWYQVLSTKDRAHLRSVTFQGIATAMADQWGNYLSGDNNVLGL
jgi:hypothetical protein